MTLILLALGALLGLVTGGTRAPSSGRTQRSRTRRAKLRLPNLSHYYRGRLRDITPGDFEFTLTLYRGKGLRPLSLDSMVESFQWVDEGPVLTGSLALRRPDPDRPSSLPIGAGHRVRLRVRWYGRWYTVWTMRCDAPSVTLEDQSVSVDLSDDLEKLRRNRRDWKYRKTKRRKRGYRADQITRSVCRREGVRVRALAKGTARMSLSEKDTSGLRMIEEAYQKERTHSGRRFVIRLRNGHLEVVPYRRNRVLYVIQDQILSALLEAEAKAHPVTVIEAKGRIGKGRSGKVIRSTVFRRILVRRYGYVRREKDYGRVSSRKELRTLATRDLADSVRPTRTATVSFPGIPFIHRGDGMRWVTREPGWHGAERRHSRDRSFVYLRSVSHSVDAQSGYVTEAVVVQEDPFQKDRERRAEEARQRAHDRRKVRRKR